MGNLLHKITTINNDPHGFIFIPFAFNKKIDATKQCLTLLICVFFGVFFELPEVLGFTKPVTL